MSGKNPLVYIGGYIGIMEIEMETIMIGLIERYIYIYIYIYIYLEVYRDYRDYIVVI